MDNTPPIIAAAMACRKAKGLMITFITPADEVCPEEHEFTCYPHDEATKQRWIEMKAKKGWKVKE